MDTPIYLNLGCGGNRLPPPWQNFDADCDITKPLPWASASVDLIFIEHCLEHVTPAQAWGFLGEAYRVLRVGGVIRIAVPSIERVFELADREYLEWLKLSGFGLATRESAVENLIVNHGHLALWSIPLLRTCLLARGFSHAFLPSGLEHSHCHPALRNIHGHGHVIGERNNAIETICVEGVK